MAQGRRDRNPELEYLSDGITESLINSLSQIPTLRVVPRSSVFRYKGQDVDARKVGRQLKVRALLTGKVLQRGDTLNVQAELVDVKQEAQLWGERFVRKVADIFAVEDEIAQQIAGKLRLKLTGEERTRLARRYTEDTEAYHLYLKGRYFWSKRTGDDLKKGLAYFEQAIARDSGYALAYAGLADAYLVMSFFDAGLPTDLLSKGKRRRSGRSKSIPIFPRRMRRWVLSRRAWTTTGRQPSIGTGMRSRGRSPTGSPTITTRWCWARRDVLMRRSRRSGAARNWSRCRQLCTITRRQQAGGRT